MRFNKLRAIFAIVTGFILTLHLIQRFLVLWYNC